MNPNDPNDLSAHHDDPLNFDEEDLLTAEDRLAEDDSDFPQQPTVTLGDIWRNNPSLKIFAVVLVVGIFLIVFMVFGKEEEPNLTQVGNGGTVKQAPGTAQLPPSYEEAVKTASEQRATEAELTGGSSLPTPIGTAERIEAPPAIENIDPLQEWRAAAEQRVTQRREETPVTLAPPPPPVIEAPPPAVDPIAIEQTPQQAPPPPMPTGPDPQALSQLVQQLTQQMQQIVNTQTPAASTVVGMGVPSGFQLTDNSQTMQKAAAYSKVTANNAAQNASSVPQPKVIITAGTIAYAQTLLNANSDIPGPILAELASGPLMGARLIGTFQMADEYLTLQFTRAIYKGKEYVIDTVAIDPSTTLPAVATDVDRHYFSRIMIPAAARFLQGYAQAIGRQGTTVVVNNSSVTSSVDQLSGREEAIQGASEAFNQLSQITQERRNRPVTVKVASGTRIGLLFMNSVTEASSGPQAAAPSPYYQQGGYQNGYNNNPQNLPPYLANTVATGGTGVPGGVTAQPNSGSMTQPPAGTTIVTPVQQR